MGLASRGPKEGQLLNCFAMWQKSVPPVLRECVMARVMITRAVVDARLWTQDCGREIVDTRVW